VNLALGWTRKGVLNQIHVLTKISTSLWPISIPIPKKMFSDIHGRFQFNDSPNDKPFSFQSSIPFSGIQQQNQHCQMLLAQSNPSTQMMVILYGIPGSGKSTLAQRMVHEFHPHNPYWISLNQDALGSRKIVERHTHDALQSGYNVIIDRCNFDVAQRKYWIQIAWEHSFHSPSLALRHPETTKCLTICLVLPDAEKLDICTRRAYHRGNDGIHEPNTEWNMVCGRMKASLRYPLYEEGLDAIYHCTTPEDVDTFLQAIAYMGCNYYAPVQSQYHEYGMNNIGQPTTAGPESVVGACDTVHTTSHEGVNSVYEQQREYMMGEKSAWSVSTSTTSSTDNQLSTDYTRPSDIFRLSPH
jgi:hypothetical protein